eukprot:g5537.t1
MGQPTPEQIKAMMAETAAKAPDHERLLGMVGSWNARMSFLTAPGAPPEVSTMKAQIKPVLDGRYVQSHYKGVFTFMGAEIDFEGMGMIGYDKAAGHYTSAWGDNLSTSMLFQTGEFEEGAIDLKGTMPDGMGGQMDMRHRHIINDDGSYTLESDAMTTESPDAMADFAELAKPAAEHALFEPFIGEFNARVTAWCGSDAEPMTSTGTMTNRLILGGKFIEHDYQDDADMYQGKGYWGYNTVDKRWEGVWIDSMCSFMNIEQGSHNPANNTWGMTGQMTDPMSGKRLRKRSLITLTDSDHHTMEMFHAEEGAEEKLSMRIEYTRARPA